MSNAAQIINQQNSRGGSMRKITLLVIHCTATKEGRDFDVDEIRGWHTRPPRNWSDIGYHYLIQLDGAIQEGRPVQRVGAHARGYNENSIGVCYVGGLDENMQPKDTRTLAQKEALHELVDELKRKYPIEQTVGHRDLPKVRKACPCFDAKREFSGKKPLPKPVDKIKEIAIALGVWPKAHITKV